VIPRLEKFASICFDPVYNSVLLCNAPAPASRQFKTERLGLADAVEWVGKYGGHEVKDAEGSFSVRLNPVAKVGLKVTRNHRETIA
jgi:hypothetical protein